MFSNRKLGAIIILLIDEGKSPEEISQWADSFNLSYHQSEVETEAYELIQDLAVVTLGPEFYMNQDAIFKAALSLIR